MLFPGVPWSPALLHHHSPSNTPSTVCLSSGLLDFAWVQGTSSWFAALEPGKGFATCSILLAGLGWARAPWLRGAAGEQLLLVPLSIHPSGRSVSSPIPWPLTEQGVLTLGYPALFQVRAAWGNPR